MLYTRSDLRMSWWAVFSTVTEAVSTASLSLLCSCTSALLFHLLNISINFHRHKSQPSCVRMRVSDTSRRVTQRTSCQRVSHKNTSLSKRILLCVSEHKLQQHEYKWASWLSVIWLSGYSKQQISERRWVIWQNNSTFPKWLRGGGSQSFVSERRREEFSCGNERNKKNLQVDLRLIAMVTGHVPRHLPSRLSPSFFLRLPQEDDTGSFCVSPPLPENSLVWMLNNHEVTDLHKIHPPAHHTL